MSYAALAYAPTRAAMPAPGARPLVSSPVVAARRTPAGGYGALGAAGATADRYRDAELASASPAQLVVMLFDKCLLTVRRAQAAFAAGDVAERATHICKAADMVAELRGSLDFEAGGAISTQLDALYAFVLRELFDANRRQEAARLGPVLHVLGGLREGFAGAQVQLAAQGAAARSA